MRACSALLHWTDGSKLLGAQQHVCKRVQSCLRGQVGGQLTATSFVLLEASSFKALTRCSGTCAKNCIAVAVAPNGASAGKRDLPSVQVRTFSPYPPRATPCMP